MSSAHSRPSSASLASSKFIADSLALFEINSEYMHCVWMRSGAALNKQLLLVECCSVALGNEAMCMCSDVTRFGAVACLLSTSLMPRVDCVCYSAYLSQRDKNDFEKVFTLFDVSSMVAYGTFQQLSERLINSEGDVRTMTRDMVLDNKKLAARGDPRGGSSRGDAKSKEPRRVLLVDEVDVFFSSSFYGEIFIYIHTLSHTYFMYSVRAGERSVRCLAMCVCVCVYRCMCRTRTYVCIHTYMHICIHTHIQVRLTIQSSVWKSLPSPICKERFGQREAWIAR